MPENRVMARHFRFAVAAIAIFALASAADARVTRIEIATKESPTFGGYSFPGVGQYEKIVGKVFGELDPNDPRNAVIVDLKLAPRNRHGRVEYSFDFYILKPIDLGTGAHKVMYEAPNRGRKLFGGLNRVAGSNDPGSAVDPRELANDFLLQRGYTLVWSGWAGGPGHRSQRAARESTRGRGTLTVERSAHGSGPNRPTERLHAANLEDV